MSPRSPGAWRRPGRVGERVASRWLWRRGYRRVARNLIVGRDEADLVLLAPDRRTIVIVEVKTTAGAGRVEERVDARKQQRLVRLGRRLEARGVLRGHPVRFDVVVVSGRGWWRRVRHWPSAFEA